MSEPPLTDEEIICWAECFRKQAHPTLDVAAEQASQESGAVDYVAYQCPHGDHYHIGRKPGSRSARQYAQRRHRARYKWRHRRRNGHNRWTAKEVRRLIAEMAKETP